MPVGETQEHECLATAVACPLAYWAVVDAMYMTQAEDMWARMGVTSGWGEAIENIMNIEYLLNIC